MKKLVLLVMSTAVIPSFGMQKNKQNNTTTVRNTVIHFADQCGKEKLTNELNMVRDELKKVRAENEELKKKEYSVDQFARELQQAKNQLANEKKSHASTQKLHAQTETQLETVEKEKCVLEKELRYDRASFCLSKVNFFLSLGIIFFEGYLLWYYYGENTECLNYLKQFEGLVCIKPE